MKYRFTQFNCYFGITTTLLFTEARINVDMMMICEMSGGGGTIRFSHDEAGDFGCGPHVCALGLQQSKGGKKL